MNKSIWKVLVVVNSLLAVGVIGLGYLCYQKKQELTRREAQQARLERLITQEEVARSTKGSVEVQAGMIEGTYVSVAYPLTAHNQPIVAIKEWLEEVVEDRYGHSRAIEDFEQAVFIDTVFSDTAFEGVKDYELVLTTFRDAEPELAQVAKEVIGHIKIRSDGQVFTLADLVTKPEDFKKLIRSSLSDFLQTKGLTTEQVSAQLAQLERVELDTLDYSYADGLLSLTLPGQGTKPSQLDLPLSELYPLLNPVFLTGDEALAYQTYLLQTRSRQPIALTFDDGPNPETTAAILDTLATHNVKATFYVLGSNIAGNEGLLKRMVTEGHEIGNHTWNHPNLTTLSPPAIAAEIASTNQAIISITGQAPKTMRPPYGASNATVAEAVGLPQVFWTVDTRDWENHQPDQILAHVKQQATPRGIVLMHDTHRETAQSVERVITHLQEQGYRFVTVSELNGY